MTPTFGNTTPEPKRQTFGVPRGAAEMPANIGRRGFLAAAAGAMVVVGCSSKATSDKKSGGESSTGGAKPTAPAPLTAPEFSGGSDPFKLGVASGDALPDSVICWTRLVPEPQAADGLGGLDDAPQKVVWEIAADEAFTTLVGTELITTEANFAHSVHVDAQGLEPDTWYWYRFRTGEYTSPVGRTRTLPTPATIETTLTLAFASCQERQSGYFTAYEAMAKDDLDLVLHLGDYIYEYDGGDVEGRTSPGTLAGTLAAFRNQYAAYKVDPHLQAAHARCPWFVTWDDHEVENNYANDIPGLTDPKGFETRRANAYQVYWEHQPLRIDPPKDGQLDLYRSFQFGSLATVFVLDGRQFRSDQVCGDKIALNRAACADIAKEDQEMLGTEQAEWLITGLNEADTTWKVMANQTIMSPLVIGDIVLNPDQWDGYPAARQRLLDSIKANGVDNVVVLTGDIHSAGAANLHEVPEDRTTPILVHEFVGTSISSPGLSDLIPNAEGVLSVESLGVEYINLVDHGYGRCTVTNKQWKTEFVMVKTVEEPTSTSFVDAVFTISAGQVGMTKV